MKLINQQYLLTLFFGSRKMTAWTAGQGYRVNRKRIRRLMRLMGSMTICRHPRTSQPEPGHKIYPYLLGGVKITRPNQVWARTSRTSL
jgi:putative transposase